MKKGFTDFFVVLFVVLQLMHKTFKASVLTDESPICVLII